MDIAVILHSTFTRFEKLKVAVDSLIENERFKIYIAYTGELDYKKLKYFESYGERVDFNYCGWDTSPAVTRNFLIDKTEENYIFKFDDDFIYSQETCNVDDIIKLLGGKPKIGLVGISVIGNKRKSPFIYNVSITDEMKLEPIKNPEIITDEKIKYYYCDITPDCWIAKKEIFPQCNYDERYHVSEGLHPDFFLQIKQSKWKVIYTESCSIFHSKWEKGAKREKDVSNFYYRKRFRNLKNQDKFLSKWKVKRTNII